MAPSKFWIKILKETTAPSFMLLTQLAVSFPLHALLRRKPSSKLSLKTKWDHGCNCFDDSRSWEQLKKHVTDKYLIKLWTLIMPYCSKCMLLLQYLSDWCLHTVYVWQKSRRKSISNWVIIWIKLKFLRLLWVLCRALASSLDSSCKGNSLARVGWALQAHIVT